MVSDREPDFLAHKQGDSVAVAVRDLTPGRVHGAFLDETGETDVELTADVPLGHKLALTDIPANADVIEYGLRIGIATRDIRRGDYVHIHNVRSARWHTSVA
jgi:(2R)-sulfolactate sulfo-lyase subunit alpha